MPPPAVVWGSEERSEKYLSVAKSTDGSSGSKSNVDARIVVKQSHGSETSQPMPMALALVVPTGRNSGKMVSVIIA